MRKRWTFNVWPFVGLWVVGGLIALFVVAGLTNGCQKAYPDRCGINGPISTETAITIYIWLAPFVLASVYCIGLWLVGTAAPALWQARPRRVIEPITEDLREIHPPEEEECTT